MIQKKAWYKSKTKIAAILLGIGPLLVTIGGLLNGSVNINVGMVRLITEVGIILGIFGIRDLPFINKI